jgi:hypothetical protein
VTNASSAGEAPSVGPARDRRAVKFQQAAFVYLHVAILYEAAAWAMWRRGLLPATRLGPPWLWLLLGAAVAGAVFVALYRWRSVWVARGIWALHALRLPALVHGAFFSEAARVPPPTFYLTAIVVVVINLWMLARAGWDL